MPGHYTDTTEIQEDNTVAARGTNGIGTNIDALDDQLYNTRTGAADVTALRSKAATEKALATDVLTVDQLAHTVAAQTGTADELSTINISANGPRWLVLLKAKTGHSITVKHNVGNIRLSTSADYVLSDAKWMLFYHDGTIVTDLGIPGTGTTDEKAKVSSNDTTAGYLNGKLVAGSNVTLTENNDAGNETLTIAASGGSGANEVNRIPNNDFETWENGIAAAPDNWAVTGDGATVAREATVIKHGNYSAKLTRSGTDCHLSLDAYPYYGKTYIRSRQVTFSAWVYATTGNRARLRISDGVTPAYSSYHTGDSTWQQLSVTYTPGAAITALHVGLQVDTGDASAYIDACALVEGASAPTYTPPVLPINGYPRRMNWLLINEIIPISGWATITPVTTSSQIFGVYFNNASPADGNEFSFSCFLEAGTYTLRVLGLTQNDSPKIDFYVDGELAFSGQDWYAAGGTFNTIKTGSITLLGSGYHVIRGKTNGKNASSSNYKYYLTAIDIIPSAD